MVKADPKHDYYADLDCPANADQESIRKNFRKLAKEYHPDRNLGKEVDVVAKFQTVQTAWEVLGSPESKARYDLDRSKLLKKTDNDPYPFRRANTTRFAPGAAPTPPQSQRSRNASVDRGQFGTRPGQAPPPESAQKFASFTRAAPQQPWDRQRFDVAATREEALRGFQNFRAQPNAPPPRPPRAPTAPKSAGPGPESTGTHGSGPGFPGMSRTANPRKTTFSPTGSSGDEPSVPRSAWQHVNGRTDRPPSSYAYQQQQQQGPPPPPQQPNSTSPPSQRPRPSVSPLRQTKSGEFRPGLNRASSRYATAGGEKTNVNGGGLSRSASVRNSPVDRNMGDSGPFGARAQAEADLRKSPPPRHHSASPKFRPGNSHHEYSASEVSSSDEDPHDRHVHPESRPKVTPRSPRRPPPPRPTYSNDPALTGHFPNTNYTRVVDDGQYPYPPPSPGMPFRKPFDDVTSPTDAAAGFRHVHKDDVPRPSTSAGGRNHSDHGPNASSFSASEWEHKFSSDDNLFRPSINERDRRSPTKTGRPRPPRRPGPHPGDSDDEGVMSHDVSPTRDGSHFTDQRNGQSSAETFQRANFSSEDWGDRLRARPPRSAGPDDKPSKGHGDVQSDTTNKRPNVTVAGVDEGKPSSPASSRSDSANPDAMDIDSSGSPARSLSGGRRVPAPSTETAPNSRRGSAGGVRLDDLRETAPLSSAAEGLGSLKNDLGASLPFTSKAADTLNANGQNMSSLSEVLGVLRLPRAPKPVVPLGDGELTQQAWSDYSGKMIQYMHDWNVFNCKMIDHFRIRQEQITLSMYHNWVTAVGEGASADQFDGLDVKYDPSSPESPRRPLKAGYATYMQWMEQDSFCRKWWDTAFDEHRECLEGLGKVRRMVKDARARNE